MEYSANLKPAAQQEESVALTVDASTAANDASTQLPTADAILEKRRRHLGPNLALFFEEEPLHIVRGSGCELFDAQVRDAMRAAGRGTGRNEAWQ